MNCVSICGSHLNSLLCLIVEQKLGHRFFKIKDF